MPTPDTEYRRVAHLAAPLWGILDCSSRGGIPVSPVVRSMLRLELELPQKLPNGSRLALTPLSPWGFTEVLGMEKRVHRGLPGYQDVTEEGLLPTIGRSIRRPACTCFCPFGLSTSWLPLAKPTGNIAFEHSMVGALLSLEQITKPSVRRLQPSDSSSVVPDCTVTSLASPGRMGSRWSVAGDVNYGLFLAG